MFGLTVKKALPCTKRICCTYCFSVKYGSTVAKVQPLTDTHMKAWQIHQYGNVKELVLNEAVNIPTLRNPNDVLIRVHAASVNPIDVRMINGFGATPLNCLRKCNQGSRFSMEFPLTLGRDFSGTVVEMGPAATMFRLGDEVWGATWPHIQGSHAEYCVVSEDSMTLKPSNISHTEAASVPFVALTAFSSLDYIARVTRKNICGKRVLVAGASGGVGSFAVQMLKIWGAEVTATCSSDAVPLVMSLGADTVIDYKTMDVDAELRVTGKYDVILNCTNQSSKFFFPHMKQWMGAKYITTSPPTLDSIDSYGLVLGLLNAARNFGNEWVEGMKKGSHIHWGYFLSSHEALSIVKKYVESKQLIPVLDEVFEFSNLKEAYLKVESGHARGKTVISICN